jgi:DNA repair protein RecO (recombination protein O)
LPPAGVEHQYANGNYMSQLSTSAILLRRTEYGDYDLILSLFSHSHGKISAIAKSAKKSTRRFAGVLELFSEMEVVVTAGRGLPVLQEAALKHPFAQIRAIPSRLAYASYWAEIIHDWMEDGVKQAELYRLLHHVLSQLDQGKVPEAVLSIVFQMRFLRLSGHSPNLERCVVCQRGTPAIPSDVLAVDVSKGGIACPACLPASIDAPRLAKGTVKQLMWVAGGDLVRAARMKFSPAATSESLTFLERFLPHHLGRQPRSLRVLRQLRGDG